jgi:dihydropteroate synthase-like protein
VTEKTLLFVTGRLAEGSLRDVLQTVAPLAGFRFEVTVPGIQVAALLHTGLLKRRLTVPDHIDQVIIPGWCQGELAELEVQFGRPFARGPKDLHDLPEYFGVGRRKSADLSRWSIEILAELNHAPLLSMDQILQQAAELRAAGADLIDVGAVPGQVCQQMGDIVRELRNAGHRVSIDSFEQTEVEAAVAAGAELILSCNQSNLEWVSRLGVEVVAVPETPQDTDSLDRLAEQLTDRGCRFRLDPILEPIGMGFAASLERCMQTRRRHPEAAMMMGVGNVSELTEVDSAGVNMLLAAICEELGIQSVLTTQVINWCRTAVAELAAARRLVHYALSAGTIPKNLDGSLTMLRDGRLRKMSQAALDQLAQSLTDPNYRIFAEQGRVHLMNSDGCWSGSSGFQVFEQALLAARRQRAQNSVSPEHAFYLGYELARAEVALLLGKQYVQDAPMNFGVAGQWGSSSAVHNHQSDQGT